MLNFKLRKCSSGFVIVLVINILLRITLDVTLDKIISRSFYICLIGHCITKLQNGLFLK